jgi:hypothetical protein
MEVYDEEIVNCGGIIGMKTNAGKLFMFSFHIAV